MATRVVNGNTHSENGWPLVDHGSCTWVRIPGSDDVWLEIQNGDSLVVMTAFAADYNAHVERLRDGDSGCWTESNDVLGTPGRNNGSNHLGGTAMDLNWNGPDGRTFRLGIPKERAYPGDKSHQLDELLDFYEDVIFCGGYWSIRDWMHFQMGGNTYNNPRTADFIRRKIRPDGLSTYRRGDTPVPSANAVSVLARATGIPESRASEILPDVSEALRLANCTNPRRIAAALAQWVVESGHFVYTEEIADGPESEDRWKYKGRTWIQLTWKTNYLGFSRWCHSLGLVPTDTYFGDHPKELAQLRWRALGPAYWWAVQYPQINEYADRGDIDNVSKWVNAPAWVDNPNKHANGEAARRDVYNTALALGDQLMALVSTSPPPVELDEWEALMASNEMYSSRSIYRDSNDKTMRAIDAAFYADAYGHGDLVEEAALRGEHWAIEKVARTAKGIGAGATKWYDPSQLDSWAIQHALYVLQSLERDAPDALRAYLAAKGQ